MPHDLHVDLGALRSVRLSVQALSAAIQACALDHDDLAGLGAVRGGAALIEEHDRLLAAAGRAAAELTELDDALAHVVATWDAAESRAMRSLTAADR